MKKSLAIFRRDLHRLLHNPIALVVALGVAVVPCLYAWLNIASNWDPYENTSTIPVAVVSKDKPVDMKDMGKICVGDMMLEELAENDKIGWTFPASETEAVESVKSGAYYAAIVIPEDFTGNLTSILDGKTDKAHLKYYVNEKANAIAPKVTDTGATTLEKTVDEQFVATAGEVIATKLGGLAGKLTAGVDDAADNIASALAEARTSLDDVDGQLDGLTTSLSNASEALNNATNNLNGVRGKGTEASNAIGGALRNFDQTRTNASNLMFDISRALNNGASTISTLSSQATYDISSVSGDIAYAQAQVDAAIASLEKDLTDSDAMAAKIKETRELLITLTPPSGDEQTLVDITTDLNDEYDLMVQITDEEQAKLDELRGIAERLESAANEVSNLSDSVNNKVQTATGALQNAQSDAVGTSLNDVNAALDSFVAVAEQIQTAAQLVDPVIAQTVSVGMQLANTLDQTGDAVGSTRTSLAELAKTVDSLTNELAAIQASDAWSLLKGMATTNPEGVKEFLSAPVAINENRLYPVANYGSGVAPFFTSVALWVGGIALVAVFKLEVDEDEVGRLRPWQAYFGRWFLFVALGTLLAIVCCTGNLLLGIQCDYPLAYYLAAVVASFAFVNIIFALSVAFKHLGKAIAFTLIILQVPGSAGMYPIEMMPPFFQAINPWLPFTYSNNAMREAIAGFYGHNYVANLLMLLSFVVVSILVGVTARSHLVNINSLFDRRLRETDHLMVSEPVAIEDDRFRLATVVKAMRDPQEYSEIFSERSAAFEASYPQLIRRGVVALFVVPLILFGLALALDNKLPFIAALVVFLIVIYVYIIVVEYFHDRIQRKRALTNLTPQELDEVLTNTLRDELMPYASIDKIIELRRRRQETSVIARVRHHVAEKIEKTEDQTEPSQGGGSGPGAAPCSDSPRSAAELRAASAPGPEPPLDVATCPDGPRSAAELRAASVATPESASCDDEGSDGSE